MMGPHIARRFLAQRQTEPLLPGSLQLLSPALLAPVAEPLP